MASFRSRLSRRDTASDSRDRAADSHDRAALRLVEWVFREFQRLDGKQRARLWQRIWCCKTGRPDLTVDDVLLEALESGDAITVNDVTKRFVDRVRMRLEKLRVRGVVIREGKGGAHREYTYRLVGPDRLAKALVEAGGGLSQAREGS